MKKHLSFICCAMLAVTIALYSCSSNAISNDARSADSTAAAADALAIQQTVQPEVPTIPKAEPEKAVPEKDVPPPPPPPQPTPKATERLPKHKSAKKPTVVRSKPVVTPKAEETTPPPPPPPPPPEPETVPKQAILGYSFFKHVERETTRYVHAYITVTNPEGKVRDTLRQLNIDDQLEKGNDTSSIFTTNMQLYKYVTLTLISADSSFKILPVTDQARQEVDAVNGNHWEWAITAIGDMPKGILVLKVDAEKPGGGIENLAPRSIPIKIDIDANILRSVWIYMGDNPGVVLTAILIPVIGYFGKRYFDGKKKAAA